MRLDRARVELRPRSAWEAMELGTALVRRHARAIWRPWAIATLPLFALLNAAAWTIDALWLAALAMWWLLPLFDRIVLLVLSRAVFGQAPGAREVLAAQWRLGWRGTGARLAWARPSPWRSIAMPVELLEGLDGDALRQRRNVVVDGIQGHAFLLTLVSQLFVVALLVSLLSLVLMFVPAELLSESARAMWSLVTDAPPRWAQLGFNLALWLALSTIEPFVVGAGFGLYLSRRVRIEAWDIELALRRMRARLAAPVACVLAAALLLPVPARAQASPAQRIEAERERRAHLPPKSVPDERSAPADTDADTLARVFGESALADTRPFRQAVRRAHEDPLLDRSRLVRSWEPRNRREPQQRELPPWLLAAGRVVAIVAEYGLWLLLGIAVLVAALTARRWWPWMRGLAAPRASATPVEHAAVVEPDTLPDDLTGHVRRLWREGRPRRALALLYRGSVEAMAARAGVHLVPGATEAECLRASRRLPEADDRDAFARVVRVWQHAAYARRLPDDAAFESLLDALSRRFGWAR
ncbi:DUF4129 domain-containing protein [Luteimonas kalidii]|uniref:DUF4129 domain-containing protein n=1 Tax=Luteimonas kalidii TaxID=3042025 RepID=A0ABT6JS12_9GAMM|nr:DUF4129 domain-containing protein [Luteimonas kalidii]MDH5833263.1 DUF4129 domain-containing protein [Luteimonas kalidii]